MCPSLKPYPAYKDSGAAWLGDVPENWAAVPNRALFTEVKERGFPNEQMLSVTITHGVIQQSSLLSDSSKKDSSNEDKSAYKLVRSGDIAYNKMRAWQGALGASDLRGIVSPAYVVLRPREDCDSRYYHYLLRTPAFAKEAERWSYGITSDMWSLRPEHFKLIHSCVPPVEEQRSVVRYLDYMDRRIRYFIRVKNRLIKLLEEQRQAIINHAVTCGIDPGVGHRPSGVESLGDLPEHWEVRRLKDVAHVQTGLTLGKDYRGAATESHPYLRVANVQQGRADLTHIKYLDVPPGEAAGATLRAGDVLMTEGGDVDKLGRGCVWKGEIPNCLHQNHVFAVRCDLDVLAPEFLVGLMRSQHGRAFFQTTAKQTTNLASTNSTTLRTFPIALPPINEQREILDELARQTSRIDAAVARTENEAGHLREYRTRLTVDVTTGRVDVREIAASLPNDTGELELVDDEDGFIDGAEVDCLGDFETTLEEVEA